MPQSLEFLLGILDCDDEPAVTWDDWIGPHRAALRVWQDLGFIATEPGPHPLPSCPHCGEGVPYRSGARCLCPECRSSVDPRCLLLWQLNLPAFLGWLAGRWMLKGNVRRIDGRLWQLGTRESQGVAREFFFRRRGPLSDCAANRLGVYRQAVVLHALPAPNPAGTFRGPRLCLLELLGIGDTFSAGDPDDLLRPRGNIRFDAGTGAIWAGDTWLGEIPVGTKEFHFLAYLADQLDRFVPYADLKRHVLRAAGSRDGTEEATFCQKLKNRIKTKWVPKIDRLLATTSKGDGYRLRGFVEAW